MGYISVLYLVFCTFYSRLMHLEPFLTALHGCFKSDLCPHLTQAAFSEKLVSYASWRINSCPNSCHISRIPVWSTLSCSALGVLPGLLKEILSDGGSHGQAAQHEGRASERAKAVVLAGCFAESRRIPCENLFLLEFSM